MHQPVVVFVVLDAFPHGCVSPTLTPVLQALVGEGGRAANGGRACLSASTYPNHATFVTGVEPSVHGIFTSNARTEAGFRPAQQVGPAAPTLFDECHSVDLRSIAVFGDQNLVGVCGAERADAHWPPNGSLPEDAPRGALGFGADRAVVAALDLPGIQGVARVAPDCLVVWGDEGRQFGIDWGLKAQHGSPRTATQLAIVGGGHPLVPELGRRLAGAMPRASDWAGWVRKLLEIREPTGSSWGHESGDR